ncbi:TetR/AcrR family transcriptional regulator [Amycolatopsis taiwanensis]|uniref:TetR/AcrR family transcriptional regulator n=1 Tax=Amycolatopsis taiwanensis TaxID=342230 RepID=UPI000489B176|nr:TetR/AcrR family transcriptional regulator [Amycolatopsis taiwanensis]
MTGRTGLRADAARNRGAILHAARALLVARGPEVGMDEIATQAGVAVGTLYRHFPTKQDLIEAIAEDLGATIAETLDAAVAGIIDGHRTAADEIMDLMRRVVVEMGDERLLRAALSDLAPQVFQAIQAHARESVERMIAMAHQAGTLRPDITVDDVILLLTTSPGEQTPKPARLRWLELVRNALTAAK